MPRGFNRSAPPPTKKPAIGTTLRLGHPLNRGLSALTTFAENGGLAPPNLATGQAVAISGTTLSYKSSSAYGAYLQKTASDVTGIVSYATAVQQFQPTDPFSVEVIVNLSSLASTNYIIGDTDASSLNGFFIAALGAGTIRVAFHAGAGSSINVTTVGTIVVNTWYSIIVTYDGSSTAAGFSVYINGVKQTMTLNTDTLSGSITYTTALALGRGGTGSQTALNGSSYAKVSIWTRTLSAAEAQLVAFNPWCMFEPKPSWALLGAIPNVAPANVTQFFPFFE